MTVQMQMGLEKFPILYWNNPGEKLGLEMLDINVASFFYKSAHRVLEMFNKQGSFFDEGGKTSKN